MKKMYWRMYQDKNSIRSTSVIIKEEEMKNEINAYLDMCCEEENPPVFEPVWMEEEEYNKLPEFEGY